MAESHSTNQGAPWSSISTKRATPFKPLYKPGLIEHTERHLCQPKGVQLSVAPLFSSLKQACSLRLWLSAGTHSFTRLQSVSRKVFLPGPRTSATLRSIEGAAAHRQVTLRGRNLEDTVIFNHGAVAREQHRSSWIQLQCWDLRDVPPAPKPSVFIFEVWCSQNSRQRI